MSEEKQEANQEANQEAELPQELNAEQAFNLLVNLSRQSKLTYDEHALVDKAVQTLSQALNLR